MKYENKEIVKNLITQIESHERKLSLLEDNNVDVVVITTDSNPRRAYTIGTDPEHEYHNRAVDFVEYIRFDLSTRINNLKYQLLDL